MGRVSNSKIVYSKVTPSRGGKTVYGYSVTPSGGGGGGSGDGREGEAKTPIEARRYTFRDPKTGEIVSETLTRAQLMERLGSSPETYTSREAFIISLAERQGKRVLETPEGLKLLTRTKQEVISPAGETLGGPRAAILKPSFIKGGRSIVKKVEPPAPKLTSGPEPSAPIQLGDAPPRPITFRERIEASLKTGESYMAFVMGESVPVKGGYMTRLRQTGLNVAVLTGRGFGEVAEFARKRPLLFTGTVALLSGGTALGARALTLGTGLKLTTSKAIIGLGIFGTAATVKEVGDPGSVLSVPGAISTATEFTTFGIGAKGLGVAAKGIRFMSPKYISFTRTSAGTKATIISPRIPEIYPPSKSLSNIPIFSGSTRISPSVDIALTSVGKPSTFYSTTATTPSQFFGIFRRIKSEPFFEVKAVPEGAGPERLKYDELDLFASRGEAFTMFGEQGVSRLGAMFTRDGKVRPITMRIGELFFRSGRPTILRFQDIVSPLPKRVAARIGKGETGPRLRRDINRFIQLKSSMGKIIPEAKTSASGIGEAQFVIPRGTKIFLLEGKEKFTFSPDTGTFQTVLDVGLKPGKVPISKFDFPLRLRNIRTIALSEILGLKAAGFGKVKTFSIPKRFTSLSAPIGRTFTPVRIPLRTRQIARKVLRGLDDVKLRLRTREITPRGRTRARERERVRERSVRERSVRERPLRENERTRVIERQREIERERTRERELDRIVGRIRIRERDIERLRIPGPRERVLPPPLIPKLKLWKPLKKKMKKKKAFGQRIYNPSLKASALKLFGPTPRILTGIRIRPIPYGRTGFRF